MTGDEYLQVLLQKYSVNVAGAQAAGNLIYPVLAKWGDKYLNGAKFSGSLAKGTGISVSTDADIFLSLSSTTPGTLSDMYLSLYNAVTAAGYMARKQDVSIGVTVNGYSIDLVPGRRQSQFGNDHSLYRNRKHTWIQTNIDTHISYIKASNRIKEIKILKLWRHQHGISISSFYLELAAVASLQNARIGNTAANVFRTFKYLRDNIEAARFIDPANTNNVVSDDYSRMEKSVIAAKAHESLQKRTWEEIVW